MVNPDEVLNNFRIFMDEHLVKTSSQKMSNSFKYYPLGNINTKPTKYQSLTIGMVTK